MHELLAYALSKMHRVVAEEELLRLGSTTLCLIVLFLLYVHLMFISRCVQASAVSLHVQQVGGWPEGHALCSGLGPAQRSSSLQLRAQCDKLQATIAKRPT